MITLGLAARIPLRRVASRGVYVRLSSKDGSAR